jgi:tRNA-2-methylthio-N6-dimethylallyladenosine synthase
MMLQQGDAMRSSCGGCSVHLETFGCQMNVLDSQLVRGQLQALGYRFVDDWKAADVVLYNTCSVREHAENKVYSRLGELALHKRERPEVIVGVIGCMAERDGLDMARRFPQVDLLCGPGELDKVPLLIDNALKTRLADRGGTGGVQHALQGDTHRRSQTLAAAADRLELLDLSRSFSPEEFRGSAYVRITRGCNKFCSFCVVPYTRGAEVHRPPDSIVEECKRLVDAGVVEITVLGQTVNHYHYDHGAAVTVGGVAQPQVGGVVGPRAPWANRRVTTFAQLLARVHEEVPGVQRLRFVTSYPRDFGDDILEVMAEHRRVCRYLHVPVQSGSDRVLKLMNRGYSVGEYEGLLSRARQMLPDVQVASDVICGFPTEAEEDHQATCELLRRARFKNCFIFKYSPRPGTVAAERLTDDVSEEVKRRRNHDLLKVQSQVSAEVHREFVGKTARVFVESISEKSTRESLAGGGAVTLGWDTAPAPAPGRAPRSPETPGTQLVGRTDGDLIVVFDGDPRLVGTIVEVRIERSMPLTLFGRLVNESVLA